MKSSLLSTALIAASVQAFTFKGPRPTSADEGTASLGEGWTPRPTPKSELHADLRRQATSADQQQLGFSAPDNTCGFLSGSLGAPITCDPASYCAVVTQPSSGGNFACCTTSQLCHFVNFCINSKEFYAGTSLCNDECRQDAQTLLCTDATAPSCYAFSFTEWHASSFSCWTIQATGFAIVETTYEGEADGRTWGAVFNTEGSASTTTRSVSSSSTTPTTTLAPKHPTPVGAIAGGVIGGVVVIAAVVGILVYLCLRRRRSERTDNQYPPMSYEAEPQPQPHQPHQPHQPYQPYQPHQPQQSMVAGKDASYPQHGRLGKQHYEAQSQPADMSHNMVDFSPPLSPAPQYSQHGPVSPGPPMQQNPANPLDNIAQLDSNEVHRVPIVNRDGNAVYEAGS